MGTITATGGGTVRDLLLGNTPVFWMHETEYLWMCLVTSVCVFFLWSYLAERGALPVCFFCMCMRMACMICMCAVYTSRDEASRFCFRVGFIVIILVRICTMHIFHVRMNDAL